jgi:hypothetical protein
VCSTAPCDYIQGLEIKAHGKQGRMLRYKLHLKKIVASLEK